jgi:hypothetical protein
MRMPVLGAFLVVAAVFSVSAQIDPKSDAWAAATPELRARVRGSSYSYFRFVNRPWLETVCRRMADEVPRVPEVQLHGDPHLEQFAVTADAYGLDDFDDSCRGPAFIDIIRFLGSVDVVLRERGWERHREALFDGFFTAYRRALDRRGFQPPAPSVVGVLRGRTARTHEQFMAWGESLMEPLSPASLRVTERAMQVFGELIRDERPELPAGFLTLKRAGRIRLGIGSSTTPKLLMRVQGMTPDPSTDQLLEAKRLGTLEGISCVSVAMVQPSVRVVDGARNLGRLQHDVVLAGPEIFLSPDDALGLRLQNWWVRSWDVTYRELALADLRSWHDVAELAADAAAQLATGSVRESPDALRVRRDTVSMLDRLEPRLRFETVRMVDDVITGWRRLK